MQLESDRFNLIVHGFSLAGSSVPAVSFRLWPLECFQHDRSVFAPGSHNQCWHDSFRHCNNHELSNNFKQLIQAMVVFKPEPVVFKNTEP